MARRIQDEISSNGEAMIGAMISKLNQLREKLPKRSSFGDDNWARIDAQREALEWVLGGDPPVSDEDLEE